MNRTFWRKCNPFRLYIDEPEFADLYANSNDPVSITMNRLHWSCHEMYGTQIPVDYRAGPPAIPNIAAVSSAYLKDEKPSTYPHRIRLMATNGKQKYFKFISNVYLGPGHKLSLKKVPSMVGVDAYTLEYTVHSVYPNTVIHQVMRIEVEPKVIKRYHLPALSQLVRKDELLGDVA